MRRKADPVDVAFDIIASMDREQYQRLQERMIGFGRKHFAELVPTPRTRQRKAKPNESQRPESRTEEEFLKKAAL